LILNAYCTHPIQPSPLPHGDLIDDFQFDCFVFVFAGGRVIRVSVPVVVRVIVRVIR
jgi:hypothetical protein